MSVKIIKIEFDTYEKRALEMAQREIDQDHSLKEIFIDGLNVSDLCINDKGVSRKCNDKEWSKFFYNNLYNRNAL